MTDNLLANQDQLSQDRLQIDPNKKYLEDLVGEGKKFRDAESLAKGKFEADHYVRTLEMRMDEMRRDLESEREQNTSRAKLEELIDQLKKQPSSNQQPNENDVKSPVINPDEIKSLVSSTVGELEKSRKEAANYNEVRDKLQERFGDKYADVLKKHSVELGLTDVEVNDLAKRNPKMFFRTFGLDQPQQQENFQSPPRTSQTFQPQGKQKRTWAHYQEMKKSNPRLYWDSKTAVQMEKDYLELGTEFEDGDFLRHRQVSVTAL